MSALPLIEAVERAGGAIALRGDRLRLSAPQPLPQNLLDELQAHKAEVIDHLQQARWPKLAQPATDALTQCTIPSVEVASWIAGVARLTTMAPPRTYPVHAWQELIVDAERFLENWAQQAAALGWPDWALWLSPSRAVGPDPGLGAGAAPPRRSAGCPDRKRSGCPAAQWRSPDPASQAVRPAPSRRALPGVGARRCVLSIPGARNQD